MIKTKKIQSIFGEILEERHRQDEKWGTQNLPCLNETILKNGTSSQMTKFYGIKTEFGAKQMCDKATENKCLTFAHIAIEEMAEILSEFDTENRRTEIIQLAAVLVQWVENIDKKQEKFNSKGQLNEILPEYQDTKPKLDFEYVTDKTTLKINDWLIITGGGFLSEPVKIESIIETTEGIEIIFNKKLNKYINLTMYLKNESWAKSIIKIIR